MCIFRKRIATGAASRICRNIQDFGGLSAGYPGGGSTISRLMILDQWTCQSPLSEGGVGDFPSGVPSSETLEPQQNRQGGNRKHGYRSDSHEDALASIEAVMHINHTMLRRIDRYILRPLESKPKQ